MVKNHQKKLEKKCFYYLNIKYFLFFWSIFQKKNLDVFLRGLTWNHPYATGITVVNFMLDLWSQDLSEYVLLSNIESGFHGEPALKRCDDPLNWLLNFSSRQTKPDTQSYDKQHRIYHHSLIICVMIVMVTMQWWKHWYVCWWG